jgi:Protein of unknown function (DUF3551)
MRGLIMSVFALLMALATSSAQAQTYDPSYPVCLQTFGRIGNTISCGYTSMEQCRLSASGRAAQCIVNPYFALADPRPVRRAQRRP